MTVHLTNAQWAAAQAEAVALEPPPPVNYLAWAERNIVFSERESAFPGPYNRDLFPEFDEIFAALGPDDPCRIVTLAKSAQLGGTVIGNVFTLGSLDMDPGDFLYVHPTEENGRRWSKMKLTPMLRSTTAMARLFPVKSRDAADSVMYKERADGRGALQISGANSPASLSQVSMRRQVQDDLAKWELNSAGDPEAQADSRSRAYEFGKILKISTPLVRPGCRISKSYDAGSQEKPYVPCPHCDEMQVLEWGNMLAMIEQTPEDPHFTCIACGGEIREHHRREMKKRLEWRSDRPKVKTHHRSFWIWSAYSVLQSFARIAQDWLKAKGDPAAEQTFMNDVAGLAYQGTGEAVPWEQLRDKASESDYTIGVIPAGALLVTIGIDCQGDRVEWQVVAWGRDLRRWVITYGVTPGHISDPKCQAHLDALMLQAWPNAVGRRIAADMVAIDGNAWTEDVWSWAKRHPSSRLIMVRGVPAESAPLLARVKRERNRAGKLLKYSRRFYNFATSVLKMALYRNLSHEDPLQRGYVAFPKGLDDEYFRQLTAERRRPVKRKDGFLKYEWVKDPNQANEGLDTMLQAEAAAIRLGVRAMQDAAWDRLEAEREAPVADVQMDLEDIMAAAGEAAAEAPPANAVREPPAPADAGKSKRTIEDLAKIMNRRP